MIGLVLGTLAGFAGTAFESKEIGRGKSEAEAWLDAAINLVGLAA